MGFKVTIIAGARPNFMKIAPLLAGIETINQLEKHIEYRLIHTGQHYDHKMSGSFFEELGIPLPHANLEAGGGTQAEQTAAIMIRFEKELIENPTDLVIVVGDVTSTMACSIAAKKLCIKVAHVEAGIRSGDITMPEEINRIVTDSISDYFYTTTRDAGQNLLDTGVKPEQIIFVGNTMIDTLLKNIPRLKKPLFFSENGLKEGKFWMLTLHRPANVDHPEILEKYLNIITKNNGDLPVVFPVHPRTAQKLEQLNLKFPNLILVEPMPYLEFNWMVKNSLAVITDSGGITEETTVMQIPCMTLRNSTERPETVKIGTNELLGASPDKLPLYMNAALEGKWKNGTIPELWDGKAGIRIAEHLLILAKK